MKEHTVRRQMRGKKRLTRGELSLLIVLVALICVFLSVIFIICGQDKEIINEIIKQDFYPVKDVMQLNGYNEDEDYVFKKNVSGKEVTVSFDFKEEICNKNSYWYSLHDASLNMDAEYYIKRDMLESILNCSLGYEGGKITSKPVTYKQHAWTEFSALIAHAGGAIREKDYNSFYTNSMEALISNYNLGHRVFEFDFYLTSDKKLAVVHDWTQFGNLDGVALSSEEWKNFQTFGSPISEGRYTTMLIEDLLDEMLVNKDMYIVTDTKAFDFTDDESKLEIQLIYDEAMKRDPELLNRVIPQIYNQEMYDILVSIYDFPSIIFTVYATGASADEIIAFSSQHDNIKVITAPYGDSRFDKAAIDSLHDAGLLIYNHTIHTYADMVAGKANGIDGFYTGLLLPKDIAIYEQIGENK